jgi:hypothetical protein
MATIYIPKKAFGAFSLTSEGKFKAWGRRPKDASEAIRMRKSKKRRVVTPAKARGMNRP